MSDRSIVEVTQADRDAAAFLYGKAELEAGECRSGRWDDSEIVQAFARHRIAEREACAMVAALYIIEGNSIHPDIPADQMKESAKTIAHTTCQHIAAAIRARS